MKNKIAIAFCLILITLTAMGQDIHITGNVFQYTRINPTSKTTKKEVLNNYEVYLVNGKTRGVLILDSKESCFSIRLTQEDLEKYYFLEFKNGDYVEVIDLQTIDNSGKIIKPFEIDLRFAERIAKPAIYLYPKTEQEVVVEHFFKGKILNTYPKYNQNWTVTAEPNGVLHNKNDNRKYNYLFWDGTYTFPGSHYNYKEGFYVAAENTINFLQEKLSKVGLNETEINDFVVYWLPELNKNDINFIHFWINDDIDNTSILTITPKPETTIRLFMEFTKYNQGTKRLPEQKLPTFERKGFTMVEWGGGLIATSKIE